MSDLTPPSRATQPVPPAPSQEQRYEEPIPMTAGAMSAWVWMTGLVAVLVVVGIVWLIVG